jgi:hypothetical protein
MDCRTAAAGCSITGSHCWLARWRWPHYPLKRTRTSSRSLLPSAAPGGRRAAYTHATYVLRSPALVAVRVRNVGLPAIMPRRSSAALLLLLLGAVPDGKAQHHGGGSSCYKALQTLCPHSQPFNATRCFACISSHQPALGPGSSANCSGYVEHEYCGGGGGHHHREAICTPPDPSAVHLENRPPVMLVPPLSGSFMDWKLVNRVQKHIMCRRNQDWIEFFPPSAQMALPLFADCYFDDASLEYDPATDKYSYPPGVEIRVRVMFICNMTLRIRVFTQVCYR